MPDIMVLGGSGFIGRQSICNLLVSGETVHGVSRHAPLWASNHATLKWHEIDLLDLASVRRLIANERPTQILHLGWYAGPGTIWVTPENLDWAAATLEIVRSFAAAGGQRIVIAGSCAEYTGSGRFTESQACNPETLYGVAKNATRQLVEAFCLKEGISWAWARLFHMYGPHESARRLVAASIQTLLKGEKFPCSDGAQVRDFLHVEDVGVVLARLTQSPINGVINIGTGVPVTLRDVLESVAHAVDRPGLLQFGARPRALKDPDVLIPDITRQSLELGWTPKFDLKSGIEQTVSWWRQHTLSFLRAGL